MGSNQYKLWDPQLNKIIYARDVVIEEWNTVYKGILEEMRDNPDNDNIGNLVGEERDERSNPETPPQSEIAQQKELRTRTGDNEAPGEVRQLEEIARWSKRSQEGNEATSPGEAQQGRQVDINEVIDRLVGDVEGEKDDQQSDGNYKGERISDSVTADRCRQRQLLQRPRRITVPF
jgi:hypothetical protein